MDDDAGSAQKTTAKTSPHLCFQGVKLMGLLLLHTTEKKVFANKTSLFSRFAQKSQRSDFFLVSWLRFLYLLSAPEWCGDDVVLLCLFTRSQLPSHSNLQPLTQATQQTTNYLTENYILMIVNIKINIHTMPTSRKHARRRSVKGKRPAVSQGCQNDRANQQKISQQTVSQGETPSGQSTVSNRSFQTKR